jgi:hypothetical protein
MRGPSSRDKRWLPGWCRILVPVALTLLSGPRARAWNDFGHMQIAAVAFRGLGPEVRVRVAQLLRLNPRYPSWTAGVRTGDADRVAFMRAATWADSIKADRSYSKSDRAVPAPPGNLGYADRFRHDEWHFVDIPFSPDGTRLVPPRVPNLSTELPALEADLVAADTSDDRRSYALVWLLHLVGDAHQPLHCVSRFDASDREGDRGGNDVKISGNTQPPICDDPRLCPLGPPGQLHAFFDTITGSSSDPGAVDAAVAALPPVDPRMAAISDPKVWIAEGVELARRIVYTAPIGIGDGPFAVGPVYQRTAYEVGQRRIALAGARLARLLNASLRRSAPAPCGDSCDTLGMGRTNTP